jgi:hypothetical protein
VEHFYITVAPASRADHPLAPAPTWVVEAADKDAARNKAEASYRRLHPEVDRLRLRLTAANARD